MIPSHAKTIWGDTLPYTESNRSWADVVKGIKYNPINYNESKYIDGTGEKNGLEYSNMMVLLQKKKVKMKVTLIPL